MMDFADCKPLLLHHMIFGFLLLQSHGGQLRVIGPSRPIVAIVGDDIILPCRLEPAVNASDMRLEWARPDLSPGLIHVRANSKEYTIHKQPSYRGRTSVSNDRLKLGDVSLKLSNVTVSDDGRYRCLIPSLGQVAFIKLIVGSVSSPVISSMNRSSSSVVLQCESKGWYPEPEVVWLDGEGNLLSAGPTETVRGPDDLYTVSSRVTVEKRHSNNFTCRVQQKDINQTRETHIYIAVLSTYVKCVLAPGLIAVLLAAVLKIRAGTKQVNRVQKYTEHRTHFASMLRELLANIHGWETQKPLPQRGRKIPRLKRDSNFRWSYNRKQQSGAANAMRFSEFSSV